MNFKMTAPCHFGLEKTLSFEIKRAGGENIAASDGRVTFTGDEAVLIRANVSCSVAERIGIVIAEFDCNTFDDIFDGVKKAEAEKFIGKNDRFPVVKGHSINSQLTSIPAIQRTIKKALVERLAKAYKTDSLPETGAMCAVRFLLMKNKMMIILDSSGEGLHKRGYRALSNLAPIKETLAAGIIDLAHIRDTDRIIDPFCGSGTIVIEAALKAMHIPPCLNRTFPSMDWGFIPKKLWEEELDKLRAGIKADSDFMAYGYDIDGEAVALSKNNAWKAGVEKHICFEKRAVKDFVYPSGKSKIICNPPYAERLLEKSEAEEIYRTMGVRMLPLGDNELYVITSNEEFETLFGQKADKNRKLYNGMLLCRLFSFGGVKRK